MNDDGPFNSDSMPALNPAVAEEGARVAASQSQRYKDIDALSQRELSTLVDWFTYFMPTEQRRRLMAEMPLTYSRLFPGASADAILAAVEDAL